MVRFLSGLVLGAAFLALLWFATTLQLLLVLLAIGAVAFHEYAALARDIGAGVPRLTTLAGTLGVAAMIPYPLVDPVLLLSGVLIVTTLRMVLSGRTGPAAVQDTAAAMLAPIYLGLPIGTLVATHAVYGREAALLLVAAVVVSDTSQYYAGRLLGRRPLAPSISPKKTMEGALGGLLVTPLVMGAAGAYLMPGLAPAALALLGALLAAAGIAGDLFESMLKRAAGVKDSGSLIPGHGGVLDRIDALLFAAPVYYFLLRMM